MYHCISRINLEKTIVTTSKHQQLRANSTTSPDRTKFSYQDMLYSCAVLELAYKLHFFSPKNYMHLVSKCFLS